MLCRMPVVGLPGDLMEDLGKSPSGKMAGNHGPGVTSYLSSSKHVSVDIYVGLRLDGVNLYQDISSSHPNINMQFALEPVLVCQTDVLTFNPIESNIITIQVVVCNYP